jgi:hypothetical protein
VQLDRAFVTGDLRPGLDRQPAMYGFAVAAIDARFFTRHLR